MADQPAQPMPIPPALRAVLEDLAQVARPRMVGGCVRDWLLGLSPKDFDIEVYQAPAPIRHELYPVDTFDPLG